VRNLYLAACLAAIAISTISSASAAGRPPVSSSYPVSTSAPVSRAADQVPANCIREACGRLFCWNTGNKR
jgi:hypothetical protein